jgi:hypothetical protein
VLTLNDFDFIITFVSDTSEDILKRNEAKKETMYEKLKQNCEGYDKPFTPATQCPPCPLHQKKQNWEMSLPNSTN